MNRGRISGLRATAAPDLGPKAPNLRKARVTRFAVRDEAVRIEGGLRRKEPPMAGPVRTETEVVTDDVTPFCPGEEPNVREVGGPGRSVLGPQEAQNHANVARLIRSD